MSDKKSGAVILRVYNAQLPVLPAPLKLRHPILAVVEEWSDEVICARLPCAALYGEGATEMEALSDLADNVLEFARLNQGEHVAGPLLRQCQALAALVEIPAEWRVWDHAESPPGQRLPSLDLAKLAPFRVLLNDSGDEFTGWPSIEARPEADLTLVHRAGFKQQFWGDLSQRQAVELAEEVVRLLNTAHGPKGGA